MRRNLKRFICNCSILVLGFLTSEISLGKVKDRLYLGSGLLDQGRSISLSMTRQKNLFSYIHQVRGFRGENYISDSLYYGRKVNKGKKYSLFAGGSLGVEQHDKSEWFEDRYIIIRPRFSLWKRYTSQLAVGADLELGKAFWKIKENPNVSAPVRGYEPYPEISIGINLKFN